MFLVHSATFNWVLFEYITGLVLDNGNFTSTESLELKTDTVRYTDCAILPALSVASYFTWYIPATDSFTFDVVDTDPS